mgnify:CR=1 FL=1|jgi:hypothetical protein
MQETQILFHELKKELKKFEFLFEFPFEFPLRSYIYNIIFL